MRITAFVAALLVPATAAFGQSLNIDFGPTAAGPSPLYAGAGLAGVWNSIEGEHTPFSDPQVVYDLVDLDGNPTGVTLHQFGGTELISAFDPSVNGEHAVLMNDALITHSSGLESCLFINGLANGTYEVITYAWRPNHPEILSRVRHDFTPGLVDVGGAWPGFQVEGVTYARHTVEVTNGFMGSHSGNVPGNDLAIGAALNGIQLRLLSACPEDLDGDTNVGFGDLLAVIGQWGPCHGSCPADLNGDHTVGFGDILVVIGAWGPCQ
ncbi:MAG: hypothetical protein ACYTGP_10830 [Planctomycetota bacterium]|jgi:hypothetical protein